MKKIKRYFQLWRLAVYEIQNWLYVKKLIRKHKNDTDWQKFNLRADWVGRIYTVLNPEMPGDAGDPMEVLRIKYAERLKPINQYLDKLGFGQAVYPAYEVVNDSNSYLVVYSPIFTAITFWRVIRVITVWVLFFVTPAASYTWQGISWCATSLGELIAIL